MAKEFTAEYFIGEPSEGKKRGRDENGYVHTLLWLVIYPKGEFFANPKEHTLARSGCGIGKARNKAEGEQKLYEYAVEQMRRKREQVQEELDRVEDAIALLRDGPASMAKFVIKSPKVKKGKR